MNYLLHFKVKLLVLQLFVVLLVGCGNELEDRGNGGILSSGVPVEENLPIKQEEKQAF